MTNEKVVEILTKWLNNGIEGMTEERLGYIEGWFHAEDREAFETAIKFLETGDILINGEDYNMYLRGYKEGMRDYKKLEEENEQLKAKIDEADNLIMEKSVDLAIALDKNQAKWETKGFYNIYYCSNCRGGGYAHYKFCPHCGAKMELNE